jgi:MinD-like ATPase involved in chromosome partitioning or flagellar assembly
MYIVTFYSFKGGVGRTMSLVNVAAAPASAGSRVLLVDFDLEAPGIPTFQLFSGAANAPGVVDYVTDYLSTSRAPDVRKYITPHPVWSAAGSGGVWLMPAGKQQASDASRLQSIDWQDLYSNHDGFILFEDMKAQWHEAVPGGFHYVLLDSRTGHTDVGGICTRQLPDSVIIMFFPNEQNLQGLVKVVNDIRSEDTPPRRKRIKMHFVASNVPDLDDEENILHTWLDRSRELLSYKEEEVITLHHYNSLSMLNQQIFLLDRPKSKLAQEYRALVTSVVTGNLEGPQGAMNSLMRMQVLLSRPPREVSLEKTDIEDELSTIARAHRHSSDILYRVALLRERMGRPEDALSMLNEAERAGATSSQIFACRAQLNRLLGHREEALDDAMRAINASDVAGIDLVNLVRIIGDYSRDTLNNIDRMGAIRAQDAGSRLGIAQELMSHLEGVRVAERMLREIMSDDKAAGHIKSGAENYLSLSLIAQQRYGEAMQVIAQERPKPIEIMNLSDAFNYAMAEWGHTGDPPKDLFSRLIDLSGNRVDGNANYLQCMAICHFIMENIQQAQEFATLSRREIRVNPRRTFTAWRYLEASPDNFQSDLDELERLIHGANVLPEFMRPERGTALAGITS